MKKLVTLILLFTVVCCYGQETVGLNTGDIVSPEIHADQTVTFRFLASEAKSVTLEGSFLPKKKVQASVGEVEQPVHVALKKDKDGVWSYTSVRLAPELYTYCFYVDGLRMLDPSNVYMQRDIATYMNYFLINGKEVFAGVESSQKHSQSDEMKSVGAANYTVNDVPHGTLMQVWYPSPTLGMSQRRMTVYLPACYLEPSFGGGQRVFPTLYLLHGAGGDENAWSELGRAVQILDNLIAQGKCVPMVVVMPNGNGAQQAAPGVYANSMYKPQFMNPRCMEGSVETAFVKDIVGYVEEHFNVIPSRNYRAIAGLSMGGFHSLYISANYPNVFGYVGLFSAAVNRQGTGENDWIYQNIEQKLKNQFALHPKLYFIAIGTSDFLYKDNVDFRRRLDGMGATYEYMETDGGHEWKNWRKYLNAFLPKLFK